MQKYTIVLDEYERAAILILISREMRDIAKDLTAAQEIGHHWSAVNYNDTLLQHRTIFDKIYGNALADS